MHSRYGLAAAVAMASLALCAMGAAPAAAKHSPPGPTVVTSFDSPSFAESLAADRHGNLYAAVTNWDTLSGQVIRITPDGHQSPFGEALQDGMVTGLAFDQKGDLYVGFASFDPEVAQGVFRVDAHGAPTQILSLGWDSFPNGLAFHAGYLYVSDSTLGAVWRVRPGDVVSPATPWLEDPLLAPESSLGANGLAFRGNDLYIAVYDSGRIVRVPVTPQGTPGDLEVVPGGEQPALAEVDGIAFDVRGNLYATTNTNAVLRLTPQGTLESLVDPSWLDYPTMPVFGTAPQARTTLFVANGSYEDGTPSVIAFDVGREGMTLP
jgi:sugar lactone lactonase YvrE